MALLLFSFACLAFVRIVRNDFVSWDDGVNFVDNLNFRGLGLGQFIWAFTTRHLGAYQPLSWLLRSFEFAAFGLTAGGYHFTSLLIHAGNVTAVYFLILSLLRISRAEHREPLSAGDLAAAAMPSLFFAVHPLRVEAVAWASSQGYLPSAFFCLLATISYLHLERPRRIVHSVILYGIGMGFHPSAIALPGVLLLLDYFPLSRFVPPARFRALLLEKLPFILAALPFAWMAILAKDEASALVSFRDHGWASGIARVGYSVWFYLAKSVAPSGLSPVYPIPRSLSWDDPLLLAGILAALAGSVAVFLLRRRYSGLFAVWFSYLILLAPNAGFIRVGNQVAADRYSYLATIPWFIGFAAVLVKFNAVSGQLLLRKGFLIVASIGVLTLTSLTWSQSEVWSSSAIFWPYVLAHGGDASEEAHNGMGQVLQGERKYDEAIREFKRAIELSPGFNAARANLGSVYSDQGRLDEAIAEFRALLEREPGSIVLRNNLAVAYARQGKFDEAVEQFAGILAEFPGDPYAKRNLEIARGQRAGRVKGGR